MKKIVLKVKIRIIPRRRKKEMIKKKDRSGKG